MLDSNTDRSYFMIGAVIIGAIIIGGAAVIFREQIFSDTGFVSKMLKSMFGEAEKGIDGINPGTIVPMIKGSLLSIFH